MCSVLAKRYQIYRLSSWWLCVRILSNFGGIVRDNCSVLVLINYFSILGDVKQKIIFFPTKMKTVLVLCISQTFIFLLPSPLKKAITAVSRSNIMQHCLQTSAPWQTLSWEAGGSSWCTPPSSGWSPTGSWGAYRSTCIKKDLSFVPIYGQSYWKWESFIRHWDK